MKSSCLSPLIFSALALSSIIAAACSGNTSDSADSAHAHEDHSHAGAEGVEHTHVISQGAHHDLRDSGSFPAKVCFPAGSEEGDGKTVMVMLTDELGAPVIGVTLTATHGCRRMATAPTLRSRERDSSGALHGGGPDEPRPRTCALR